MNEKTMNQIAEMKKQTIGVEVEMNSITRRDAAKTAAEFFGTGRCEDTAYRNGYRTWSAWDAQGREWKFQRDSSIHGPDAERCEMVTPILTYEDMDLLQELIRWLRKAGAKSDATRGCGVHIHIGAKGHTPQSLRNLANIMASHEDLLADALKIDQSRIYNYCHTVDPRFLTTLNQKKPTTMSDLADIWYTSHDAAWDRNQHYNDSRYHMLNLHEMSVVVEMAQSIIAENAHIAQNQDEYQKRYDALMERYDAAKVRHGGVVDAITAKVARSERLSNFIGTMQVQEGILTEFDERLWSSMVDFVTVGRKKEITITFRDGTEITA